MNDDEKIANDYLSSVSGNVIYEPDGNIPPDFSVDISTGVEVRRLNQHYFSDDNCAEGLESDYHKITKMFQNLFKDFESEKPVKSYFVSIRWHKPLGKISDIKKNARIVLNEFLLDPKTNFHINIADSCSIGLLASSLISNQRFKIGSWSDHNSGGFVVSIILENLKHCISEKTVKIAPYGDKYESWWLVLINYVYPIQNIDKYERRDFFDMLDIPDCWEKVIVLNPKTAKEVLVLDDQNGATFFRK